MESKIEKFPKVGMVEITLEPFKNFLHICPRNFAIAFWIELLIAQPILS